MSHDAFLENFCSGSEGVHQVCFRRGPNEKEIMDYFFGRPRIVFERKYPINIGANVIIEIDGETHLDNILREGGWDICSGGIIHARTGDYSSLFRLCLFGYYFEETWKAEVDPQSRIRREPENSEEKFDPGGFVDEVLKKIKGISVFGINDAEGVRDALRGMGFHSVSEEEKRSLGL